MNENNNQNLERNQINNSGDNSSVINDISSTGIVEEVNFSYPDLSQTAEVEKTNEDNCTSNVSVEEGNNVSVSTAVMEEVSVTSDDFDLDKVEVSDNSIFNQVKDDEVVVSSLKEGHEDDAENKGFPYVLVIGFVVLLICVLFIDSIVEIVQEVVLDKDAPVEEASEVKE